MLQQTQVARVLEKFGPFLARFPSARALAEADERAVLAAWSGLGYYRRARQLHAAAKAIIDRHGGEIPLDIEALRDLPGVGRYTAGALASIVFHSPEPAVDGNISRVLLRIEGRETDEAPEARERWVWRRASELVASASDPGPLNEGLMELGATVCTPASPNCKGCPVAEHCQARERGATGRIPPAKKKAAQREVFHASVVVRGGGGRVLLEQRPSAGLWASLWQVPTVERDDRSPMADELMLAIGLASVRRAGSFTHITTHRKVRIDVWEGALPARSKPTRGAWFAPSELEHLGISNAQKRILGLRSSEKAGNASARLTPSA